MDSWACICRYGGIGDNLIVSAVFPALKNKYDKLEVITQVPQHVVFDNNPYVDKISVHKPGEVPGDSNDAWQGWHKIRSKEYGFFVNLSHSCETLRALLKGQTQFYWPAEMRRKMCGQSYVETVADICGVPYDQCFPGFFPTQEEWERACETKYTKIGERCIGWVMSGTRIDKMYPYAGMTVARLIKEVGVTVALFGAGKADHNMAKQVQENVHMQNGSLEGLVACCDEELGDNQVWPIRRLLTQIQACDLVISPDTGPAWAVASCDMPKIMMVSHASPENITKGWHNTVTLHANPEKVPCHPCHLLHDDPSTCTPNKTNTGAACISDVSVEAIVKAARVLCLSDGESRKLLYRAFDSDQLLALI